MKKVLVTGGAGFIGSHIVQELQGKAEIVVLDSLRSGYRHNLDGFACEFLEGDIRDRATVKRALRGVDHVFHLAALVSVPESMEKIRECVEINAQGFVNVLEEARAAGVEKLCFSTSAAIYGDNPTVPKIETMFPEPKSPYAVTKLDGEYYAGMFTREYGLPCACLRYFNVFGPRQDPKGAYAAAVPIFITRALADADITIYGDGEQTRDFIYVKDIVGANLFFAQNDATGVFNIANGGRITINDLAETIVKITGSKSKIRHLPERAGDVKHSMACVDKAAQAGYRAGHTFDEGLAATIDFYRSRGRR
jgi:UDP-glucose 4-epimerase